MAGPLMKTIGIIYLIIQLSIIFLIMSVSRNNIYKVIKILSKNPHLMIIVLIVSITYSIIMIKK
ncbi:hypothetical protein CPAST_c10640 [Clostridium pasteurianum DSM 525 = ATCC 6013]|uniref:Uncharacterized protein n=1 Tax=Clostridium pasteurianum DSM 525 = ATCC 6013 TaxID=1262449 RepID=A0A0H3J1C2_CLOPA|nr:hypothetical protein [Clostridium pasteurianum]AJA47164.1 hypothetical protein CPAST_c10640 [Clostridium pasteurianum DSM 525 = ATCC 6013]AJA51152.1 hypothetical protein CLPA_c10640 [Clostridium pasteurianum DSM 525 = ATCC 6013]AOZ74522.1 hypothetical protein AQ983_05150 [Clostridium pasteurianum DSM 525 = ATCC 6013]AOZ78319.1 hypothetical protein AQ984_05140 [Clostridium pasteurianum]ELP59449.1 hypothetical protein F502_09208 [Clostridium pasteurianum DSM 525 = ATCC 6013]